MRDVSELARKTLTENRVAIFIVAYNAERHIEDVLRRIPEWVAERLEEIFIIDDHSTDNTVEVASKVDWPSNFAPLRVFRTPYNQGYGGNQRLGYLYAISQGYDIVILLHGDGQYAPEALPHILAPYAEGADVVFGSRFLTRKAAIKGGMPLYKWVGNRILTKIQNSLLNSRMSEMHSGYRSYRTSVLRDIPFTCNSLGFDFDADIIIQVHAAGYQITEVPIPTYYGDEICRVNGMNYAWRCVRTSLAYRIMQFGIFYDPKFDIRVRSTSPYTTKQAKTSLHYYIRHLPLQAETRLIDIGGGDGDAVGQALATRGIAVTSIDQNVGGNDSPVQQHAVNLDLPWKSQFNIEQYDTALALDVLEHLKTPEQGAEEIFKCLKSGGKLYASTGNVAFILVRLALFVGWFNYGRRGILDLTHKRLFTVDSFRRLLEDAGFRIDKVTGFGPPLSDLSNRRSWIFNSLDQMASWLAKRWPRVFAYQILIECTRTDSPDDLMAQVFPLWPDIIHSPAERPLSIEHKSTSAS